MCEQKNPTKMNKFLIFVLIFLQFSARSVLGKDGKTFFVSSITDIIITQKNNYTTTKAP